MLKVFLRLLLLIAAVIAVLMAIGWCLPRGFEVAVERTIAASPQRVYDEISDLRNWSRWTAWAPERNAHLKVEYGPQTVGTGASQSWTDPRGSGKLWVTEVDPGRMLGYQSRFWQFPEMSSRIELSPVDGNCRVRWSSSGRLPGGAFYGYFRSVFVAGLKREYDSNLTALEQVLTRDRDAADGPGAPPAGE